MRKTRIGGTLHMTQHTSSLKKMLFSRTLALTVNITYFIQNCAYAALDSDDNLVSYFTNFVFIHNLMLIVPQSFGGIPV